MEFFEIKNPLRKIGLDKYVIGPQPLDPLVLIEGKKLSTKQIDVEILNFNSGFFSNLSGENVEVISGYIQSAYINNLVLQTGTFVDLSGENLEVISGHTENSTIDNLGLQTGTFVDLSGENLEVISGRTEFSIIGDLTLQTGRSDTFYISGINILEFLQNLSGNLETTGLHLHEHIEALSGNLEATGLNLISQIDLNTNLIETTQQNLVNTGTLFFSKIDEIKLGIANTGSSLLSGLNHLESKVLDIESSGVGGGVGSGIATNRFLLNEAFEEDEFGDVTPTNHEFISDPMWILREDNNLEVRANIWRRNTGPEAFTDDISF